MAFIFLLAYLALSFVYPAEVFPELAPYRITLVVGILGMIVALFSALSKSASPLKMPQLWLMLAFTVSLAVSTTVAERWLGAPVMTLQRFGPSLTMFTLAVLTIDSLKKLRIVAVWVGILSLIVLTQAALAFYLGYNASMYVYDREAEVLAYAEAVGGYGDLSEQRAEVDAELEDGADYGDRIRGLGVLNDPNDLAMGFVVVLGLLSGVWLPRGGLRNLLLVVLPGAALSFGVFLTHSRGGALALAVTLGLLAFHRWGKMAGAVVLPLLLTGIVLLDFGAGREIFNAADDSATSRITAWTEGLEMFKQQPLLGVGYGAFVDHFDIAAHNSFVHCFAETGAVGYFFWLGLLVTTLVQLQKLKTLRSTDPEGQAMSAWAWTIQLSMIGFMSAAFFLSRTYVPILYLVVGLAVSLVLMARNAGKPIWSPPLPNLLALLLVCEGASVLVIYFVVKLNLV